MIVTLYEVYLLSTNKLHGKLSDWLLGLAVHHSHQRPNSRPLYLVFYTWREDGKFMFHLIQWLFRSLQNALPGPWGQDASPEGHHTTTDCPFVSKNIRVRAIPSQTSRCSHTAHFDKRRKPLPEASLVPSCVTEHIKTTRQHVVNIYIQLHLALTPNLTPFPRDKSFFLNINLHNYTSCDVTKNTYICRFIICRPNVFL